MRFPRPLLAVPVALMVLALALARPMGRLRAEEPPAKPLLVCPECGELGTAEVCPEDDERCLGAHLLVFHQTLNFLAHREEPLGANPWKDLLDGDLPDADKLKELVQGYEEVAPVASFAPWTSALPPPPPSAKRACPRCPRFTEKRTCEVCAAETVRAELLHFQQVVSYLAALDAREGVQNPFASVVAGDGTLDARKLDLLVRDYKRASRRKLFLQERGSRLPLNHPFAVRVHELAPFQVFRAIQEAQATWRRTHDGYATLDQLVEQRLVPGVYSGMRSEYRFTVQPTESAPEDRWVATAVPEGICAGERHYFTNETGKVWFTWRPIPSAFVASGKPPPRAHLATERSGETPLARTEEEREALAIGVVRRIVAAELLHAAKTPGFVPLADLAREKRIPDALATSAHRGYTFAVVLAPSSGAPATHFAVTAEPSSAAVGRRHFYASEKGDLLAANRRLDLDESLAPTVPVSAVVPPPARTMMNGIAYAAGAIAMWGTEPLYESRWFDAVEPLEAALMIDGIHVETWNNLGKAYLELESSFPAGPDPSARAFLERAIDCEERSIASAQVRYSAYTYMAHGNLARARLKLVERTPPTEKAAIAGLLAQARVSFEAAIALTPGYESALLGLAKVLADQADAASGLERRALALHALDAVATTKADKPEHPAHATAAPLVARAYKLLDRRAAAFVALAALASPDAAALDALAQDGEEAAAELDEKGDFSEERKADRALVKESRDALAQVCERLEKAAADSGTDASRRVKLAAAAARVSRSLLADTKRARRDYTLAIEAAEQEDVKEALGRERAALGR